MSAVSDATTRKRSTPWIVVYVTLLVAVITNGAVIGDSTDAAGDIASTTSVESQVQQTFFQPRFERTSRDDI